MIIGSTSGNIYQRFAKHISGRVDNLSKKAARYVVDTGIQHWIILHIGYSNDRKQLYEWEGIWAKRFKNYLINNPIQLVTIKPTRKRTEKKKLRDSAKAKEYKLTRYKWQSYIYTIMNQDTWKQWNELALINLLINMKKAKLPINIERETSHIIRNHLNKTYHFKLKPYYLIRIPTMRLDIRNQLKAWIKHYMNQHYTDAYSSYVANHTKIIMESTIKLGNLIDNTKKILKNTIRNHVTVNTILN